MQRGQGAYKHAMAHLERVHDDLTLHTPAYTSVFTHVITVAQTTRPTTVPASMSTHMPKHMSADVNQHCLHA